MAYVCEGDDREIAGLGILEIMMRKTKHRGKQNAQSMKERTQKNIESMTKEAERIEAAKADIVALREADAEDAAASDAEESDWVTMGLGAVAVLAGAYFFLGR